MFRELYLNDFLEKGPPQDGSSCIPSSPRTELMSSSFAGRRIQYRHSSCPLTTRILWLAEW